MKFKPIVALLVTLSVIAIGLATPQFNGGGGNEATYASKNYVPLESPPPISVLNQDQQTKSMFTRVPRTITAKFAATTLAPKNEPQSDKAYDQPAGTALIFAVYNGAVQSFVRTDQLKC